MAITCNHGQNIGEKTLQNSETVNRLSSLNTKQNKKKEKKKEKNNIL